MDVDWALWVCSCERNWGHKLMLCKLAKHTKHSSTKPHNCNCVSLLVLVCTGAAAGQGGALVARQR